MIKITHHTQKTQNSNINFRSIRYKIKSVNKPCHTQNKLTLINNHMDNQSQQLSQIPDTTNYQNRGYSMSHQKRIKRGFSIKQNIMVRTSNQWQSIKKNDSVKLGNQYQVSTYIDTFKQLILNNPLTKTQKLQWKNKSRINIPQLQENGNSKFSMLEPMSMVSQFLTETINQNQIQLKKNKILVFTISQDLNKISTLIQDQLKNIESECLKRIKNLRGSLKKSAIIHQENQLQAKQNCTQLNSQFIELDCLFDKLLESSQNLQQHIFNSLPFQLIQNPQFEQFQQKLF